MIASLVRTLIGLLGLVVIVVFAVANRGPVDVNLVIVPMVVTMPLYGLFLLGLLAGVVLGGIAAWLGSWRTRHEGKVARRRLGTIEAREQMEQRRIEEQQLAERKQRRQQLALAASDKAA